MKTISLITTYFLLLAMVLLSACNGDNPEANGENDGAENGESKKVVKEFSSPISKTRQVFYALPSPFELASLLRHSGANFNANMLHNNESVGNYIDTRSQAFNLGVYGADLSYSSIFGQTQSAMKYLTCVKKLTEALDISSAFDQQTMNRLEENNGNDDSLQRIVADAYLIANSFLKENEKENLATIVLVGGWIEGMYIATELAKEHTDNIDLMDMISEQKFALENIVAMLELDPEMQEDEYVIQLKELHEVYQKLEETSGAVELSTDESGKSVIGGSSSIAMTPEQLAAISNKIAEIRNKIIS